jgi:DNA-directed RNA polymerase sigma subunit (sigma70/sigma32)
MQPYIFNQNFLALMTVHYFKPIMPNIKNRIEFSLKERRFHIEAELESKMGFTSELLEVLGDRDLYILYRAHGFEFEKKSTLEEIGNEFGISRQRVHVIKNRSLARLRERAQELAINPENLTA